MVGTANYPILKPESTAVAVVIFNGEYHLRTGHDLHELYAWLSGDKIALQGFEVLAEYGGIKVEPLEPLLRYILTSHSVDQRVDLKLVLDKLMAQLQSGKKLKSDEIMAKLKDGKQIDLENLEALLD